MEGENMKKRFLVLAGTLALSIGVLTGCGAPKPEEFVDKMMENEMSSFAGNIDMDVDMTVNYQGMGVGLKVNGDMDVEVDSSDKDAPASHVAMNLSYEALGSSDTVKTEAYSITEDGQLVAYALEPESNTWVKTSAEVQEKSLDEETLNKIREVSADVLKTGEVQKDAVSVNGEDCWVLKVNTTADAYSDVYDILLDAAGDEAKEELEGSGVDKSMIESYLSYFNVDMTVYASKKDGRCVKMEYDLAGSDTAGLLNQVNDDFGSMIAALGVDVSNVSIDFDSLNFSIEFTEWNNVTVTVPDSVIESAEEVSVNY